MNTPVNERHLPGIFMNKFLRFFREIMKSYVRFLKAIKVLARISIER